MSQALIDTHGPALQAYWNDLPEGHQDHLTENPSLMVSLVQDFFAEFGIEISQDTARIVASAVLGNITGVWDAGAEMLS